MQPATAHGRQPHCPLCPGPSTLHPETGSPNGHACPPPGPSTPAACRAADGRHSRAGSTGFRLHATTEQCKQLSPRGSWPRGSLCLPEVTPGPQQAPLHPRLSRRPVPGQGPGTAVQTRCGHTAAKSHARTQPAPVKAPQPSSGLRGPQPEVQIRLHFSKYNQTWRQ